MIKIVYSFFITFSIFLSFFCFELLAMETAKEDKSKISSTRKRKREELPPGQQQITSFFSKALPSSSLPQPRALIAHSSHLTYPPSIPALPIGGDTRASPFVAKAVHPPSFSDELSSSSSRTASLLPTVSDDKTNRGTEKITFLRGTDDHIRVFADLINSARERIILASWKLGFIPEDIFQALMKAKRNGVSLSFIVNSIQRKETLEPFTDEYDDDFEDSSFVIAETRSHAKFLFVDSQKLVLGSFNALGDSPEESEDASFLIEGSIQQMWPYFMRIRDIYTELDEEETVDSIFGCIAAISSVRYGNRNRFHLQRTLSCGTRIHLLKTVHDHEEFFRLATPSNGHITIYSPFSFRDNTLTRLEFLQKRVPSGVKVTLKVLPEFQPDLTKLLERFPSLKSHTHVESTNSHQKVIILGDETLCIGSLNWLSAAQSAASDYSNLELSLVLQGPKAAEIIREFR
ncbi:MAG: hypothetical protein ACD_16C00214G0002 [uncultured bacterium]|nr:MAG: hypothetical protein ACD_16C00214G0002 [uncultured bacterium]OFW69900.1 MAG: hypothetical protein A2X70_05995 [Alphaproteobacteria bacterium GWC2_42_16]OFW74517.1 MAG: hypothetical protein A2Z80_04870 [Alphaproteobacteria bacterium GWA2_41_27]OFW84553.1 MAG: hypothetical protein A2W06_04030 [Alphaproteobacteria bacterium RBG_16_42_14]OFW84576.1 MAG: hypothetical protein A3E50_02860 [Alphaproteobacteria bacterium RIFCSPHIGHO2_12_FULL_42_100]OFW91198.1 MAG: hypothetical protein A2W46_006